MAEDSGKKGQDEAHSEAQAMLEAFASVGATHFDVTHTTQAGDKVWFRRGVSLADLAAALPRMLETGTVERRNVIVRPNGLGTTFIQLDDLKSGHLPRLAPAVFLSLETSPGNFQGWVAMPTVADKDFARRLRKGTGADPTASGATRVAGSLNFKDKYAPNFPRVAIHEVNLGRWVEAATLEQLGVVAPPEMVETSALSPAPRGRPSLGNRKWPSYARALDGAPLNHGGTGPDTSRADFVWCMTALTWGWTIEETQARLMEESDKAKANGAAYAERTARNAALAVERRQPRPLRTETHDCR